MKFTLYNIIAYETMIADAIIMAMSSYVHDQINVTIRKGGDI